jgi:hypothetical protein
MPPSAVDAYGFLPVTFLAPAGVGNGYLASSKDARFENCNFTAEQ